MDKEKNNDNKGKNNTYSLTGSDNELQSIYDEIRNNISEDLKATKEQDLKDLDSIFKIALGCRVLFPPMNLSERTKKNYLSRWVDQYINEVALPPSKRVATEKKTCDDPAVSLIVKISNKSWNEEDLVEKENAHNLFMAAENVQGSLLEEYIAIKTRPYGFLWCAGRILTSVDFCTEDGRFLLQIKNKYNTENSSSNKIRKNIKDYNEKNNREDTPFKVWYRLKTTDDQLPLYNWEELNGHVNNNKTKDDMEPCYMTEDGYIKFLEKVTERNMNLLPKYKQTETRKERWENRHLKNYYPFIFVESLNVTLHKEEGGKNCPIFFIFGYDINGQKDILAIWLNRLEGKDSWMQVFDEIRQHGVEEISFINSDKIAGLKEAAKSVFKDVVVYQSINYFLSNANKCLASDAKSFLGILEKVFYLNTKEDTAKKYFNNTREIWVAKFPDSTDVWDRALEELESLFCYGDNVRKMMHPRNDIIKIKNELQKITKLGLHDEDGIMEALFVGVRKLQEGWEKKQVSKWDEVCKQLATNETAKSLF